MSEYLQTSSNTKTKKKLYKRPKFWVGAVILLIIISATNGGTKDNKTVATISSADKSTAAASVPAQSQTPTPAPSTTATPSTPASTPATTPNPSPAPAVTVTPVAPSQTVSQKNAVKSAKQYLNVEAFSHDGLVAQLEYEQYSTADATYGADNSGGDWNAQAAKSAKQYLDIESFSRDGLITQLEYEKYTPDQAVYGVNAVGL